MSNKPNGGAAFPKAIFKTVKCQCCDGTGFRSGAENMPTDTPTILMPIGTWRCENCKGTGKVVEPDYIAMLAERERGGNNV